MHPAEVVALAYKYPHPQALEALSSAVGTHLQGTAQRKMINFISAVSDLSLGEWEELHSRTLDLSPLFIPYVGHVEWGENYKRGEFMAELKVSMESNDVDLGGELPDHIEPILRYLALAPEPLDELVEILPKSVAEMRSVLKKAERKNPYRHVLAATVAIVEDLQPVAIGTIR